ncbi:DUF5681 domain-containing protein [Paraflavitalea pollutisoli]|uniref:DUF5681 domain-containing protein n=1 Tax=Paraflavitalea pollutisoli TaxID=3034143 RepID=UPI003B8306D1
MKFKKGQSRNPNGRPKGSLNKSTMEIREVLSLLAVNNIKKFRRSSAGRSS